MCRRIEFVAGRREEGTDFSEQTRVFLGDLGALTPNIEYASAEHVNGPVQKICRDQGLTSYDALYVELAMRAKCPLATLDAAQKIAANALSIECV